MKLLLLDDKIINLTQLDYAEVTNDSWGNKISLYIWGKKIDVPCKDSDEAHTFMSNIHEFLTNEQTILTRHHEYNLCNIM